MKRLLTSKEAATYLGYSDDTMKHSRVSGTLGGVPAPKHVKLKMAVRYPIEELDKWVEELKGRTG